MVPKGKNNRMRIKREKDGERQIKVNECVSAGKHHLSTQIIKKLCNCKIWLKNAIHTYHHFPAVLLCELYNCVKVIVGGKQIWRRTNKLVLGGKMSGKSYAILLCILC